MAHTAWKGGLRIGLLTIPVKLHGMVSESGGLRPHQAASDGTRIQYRKVRAGTSIPVSDDEIRKAVELPNGIVVVLDDDAYKATLPQDDKTIAVLGVIPADGVGLLGIPAAACKDYWLHPDALGDEAYALLARELAARRLALAVSLAFRDREHLGLLTARDRRLHLATIPFREDVREPDREAPSPDLTEDRLSLMRTLLDALPQGFDWAAHPEAHRKKLADLLTRTLNEKVPAPVPSMPPADLGPLLEAAVAQARASQAALVQARASQGQQADDGQAAQPPSALPPGVTDIAPRIARGTTPPRKAARRGSTRPEGKADESA